MEEKLSKESIESTKAQYAGKITDVEGGDPSEYKGLGNGAVPVLGTEGGVVVPRTGDFGGVNRDGKTDKYGMPIPIMEVATGEGAESFRPKRVGTFGGDEKSGAPETPKAASDTGTVVRERTLDALEAEPAAGEASPAAPEPERPRPSVTVTLTGDFGVATVKALTAFREGNLMVVVTDPEEGFSFTPPPSREGRFTVKVKNPAGNNWTARAAFAGTAYDMPDGMSRHMVFVVMDD